MLRKKLKLDEPSNNDHETKKSHSNNEATTSQYFPGNERLSESEKEVTSNDTTSSMIKFTQHLNSLLKPLRFTTPVAYCYNPLEYALKPYTTYIKKYCTASKDIIFVGMNPGPFGMCQTGIPFGEVNAVKDWLQICDEVSKPDSVCAKRPVLGFASTRSEESGKKFWGLFQDICKVPEEFFKSAFVYNYCPLAFMNKNGANITPNNLKVLNFYISFDFKRWTYIHR